MENNITIILFIISGVLMVGGLLIFFAPKFLIRISEPLNKEFGTKSKSKSFIPTDEKVFLNRHIIGPTLVLLGVILIFISYYLL